MKIRNGLRAKTREEVAAEYGVTSRTLYNWIKSHGLRLPRGIIKPIHLNAIYLTFGYPGDRNE
jgi:hypothetical protein